MARPFDVGSDGHVSDSLMEMSATIEVVSNRPRWVWAVTVLAVCHAAAVATFQILNILVEPIKASLSVTDTQYSLMQGLAVAVCASGAMTDSRAHAPGLSADVAALVVVCGG